MMMPPPQVRVAQPTRETVIEYLEFTGTTEASASVEIRARVEGFLEKVLFQAGALVKEGDLLFVIDPKPFEANLKSAEAALATAEAMLELAKYNQQRMSRLREDGTAAELELVQMQAAWDAAKAEVMAAEAVVDKAKIDLGYTQIRAPISGRISRNLVDAGNLVGAGENTLLTTIVKNDPIYAYFSATEAVLLDYLERHPEERLGSRPENPTPFYLTLDDNRDLEIVGHADWADNRVDPDTGTIRIRGIFPNKDHILLPGLYARIRAPGAKRENAILIPEACISADALGRYVFVLKADDTVEKRHVATGPSQNGLRVIENGLDASDWVVVAGILKVRHGMKVQPIRGDQPPKPSTPPNASNANVGEADRNH